MLICANGFAIVAVVAVVVAVVVVVVVVVVSVIYCMCHLNLPFWGNETNAHSWYLSLAFIDLGFVLTVLEVVFLGGIGKS